MTSAAFIPTSRTFSKIIKKNFKKVLVLIVFVTFLFTRTYDLENKFGFDHDQEKAALAAWQLIKEKNFSLLGIETSTGGIFAGPALNWSHSIFLLMFKFDPVALAYQAIVFSLISIFLLYFLLLQISNITQALIGTAIYVFSARMISYDISGSPISYIFPQTILVLFLYFLIVYRYRIYLLPVLCFTLGLGYHIHLTLLLQTLPLIYLLYKKKHLFNVKLILISLISFLTPFTSFVLFELRNKFLMTHNLIGLFQNESEYGLNIFLKLKTYAFLLGDILLMTNMLISLWTIPILVIAYFLISKYENSFYKDLIYIMVIPVFPAMLYKSPITEYYFLFGVAAYIVLASRILFIIFGKSKITFVALAIILLAFNFNTFVNVKNPHSLMVKKDLIKYLKLAANNEHIEVIYDIPKSYNYGFNYLSVWNDLKTKEDSRKKFIVLHKETLSSHKKIDKNFGYFSLYSIE